MILVDVLGLIRNLVSSGLFFGKDAENSTNDPGLISEEIAKSLLALRAMSFSDKESGTPIAAHRVEARRICGGVWVELSLQNVQQAHAEKYGFEYSLRDIMTATICSGTSGMQCNIITS